jgi:hypothetical protein
MLKCKPSSIYNLTRGRARYGNPIPVLRLPMGLRFRRSSPRLAEVARDQRLGEETNGVCPLLYTLAPLERHSDDGFGAVGEAFKAAADKLVKADNSQRMFWSELPVIFLLRHAIELFLKSGIIIMHRRLKLPYDAEGYKTKKPMLLTSAGSWKPLLRTHDILAIYWYWKKLLTENIERLVAESEHGSDMTIPDELDGWIVIVGAVDPSSDYFRYPVTKNENADKAKSSFKEVALDSLFPSEASEEKVHAMIVEDQDGNVVRAFKHDNSTNRETEVAAWKAADMLSNFHIMLRVELMGGW